MDLNDEGRLRNVFWADGRSRTAYGYFGDAITFDTTYLTNKYNMAFAPFVGVNHHGQSILLGCGLLVDETTESFIWLFKAWLNCMSGCSPPAIVTDQCKAIQKAVAKVFPKACHHLCLWHIMQKLPQKLSAHHEYHSIKMTIEAAVYDTLRVREFEFAWNEMIQVYELHDNEWLRTLYEEREKWVPVFLKDTFYAGMSTTQRSESMNSFFDGYVHRQTSLSEFVGKYDLALQDKHQKEARVDFDSRHSEPVLKTKYYYEKQLSKVYIHGMFKKFQVEVDEIFSCFNISLVKVEGSIQTFIVKQRCGGDRDMNDIRNYEVWYNTEEMEVQCICNMFKFKGYLCRHSLSVLHYNGINEIPPQYILSRWRKDFKRTYISKMISNEINCESSVEWYDQLFNRAIQIVEEGTISIEHFKTALHVLEESLKKVQNVEDSGSNKLLAHPQPSISKGISVKDPIQAKRPGRPKQSRYKNIVEKLHKVNQTKQRKSKSRGSRISEHVSNTQESTFSEDLTAQFDSTMNFSHVDIQENFEQMSQSSQTLICNQSRMGCFQSLLGQVSQKEPTFHGQPTIGTNIFSYGGCTVSFSNEIDEDHDGGS